MADNETSYPIYNQYAYKDGVGWVMMGASDGSSGATIQINDGTVRNLDTLVINKLTRAEFEALTNPSPDQLYIITDDVTYATVNDLPQPGNTTPQKDGTGSAGSASTYSRSDHVHPAEIPSQTNNSGKFLTTNGSAVSWATVDALPSQNGQSGKFLTTNGSAASWATVTVPTKTSDLTNDSGYITMSDVPAAGETNQNAYTTIKVGSTDVTSTSKTGTFTVTAGTGIGLTPNTTSKSMEIKNIGVTAIAESTNNGKLSVTQNGETNDISIHGLGTAAYQATGHFYETTESHSAHQVLAAPSDSSGVATFRTLAASDIPTLNYVPTSRTVNGKELSSNISLTASDVSAVATSSVGTVNGVAELDSNGLVPSSQLPSYVDDVVEYAATTNFPVSGESGKIYVATSTGKIYRWSGTQYTEISASLALGETSSTAYRGDRGKTAYTHATETRLTTAKSEGLYKIATTAEGHIGSATAVAKADITALGIPAQDTTYTFDGTYNASTNKAATVSTVTNAINALDGGTIGTGGTGKTITSLSQSNGNVSATFENISITKSQISDFPSSMTPSSHTHGNLSNDGKITSTATIANGDRIVIVDSDTTAGSKITGSSITFDGSTITKALTQKGTWETFNNYSHPTYTSKTSALYKITVDGTGHVSGTASVAAADIPELPASKITSGTFADARIASASTWNAKQDALTFDGTYNSSSNKVATVSTVTSAIQALDVSNISGFGAGKTLSALSETDGKISATFQDISITKSQISDFPTSMTPTSHTHGKITNAGAIASTDNVAIANNDRLVIADSSDSHVLKNTSIVFDGSTATKALTQKGTWETFNNYSHPTGDGNLHVPATGTSNNGKVLKAGSSAGSISWGSLTASDVGATAVSIVDSTSGTTSTTNLTQLVINKLTKAQYDAIATPDSTQLYMITDDTIYATKTYVDNLIANIDALPSQSGNSGKYLTTNGTTASWATINALPSQSGNSGKFLTTNGTTASWTTPSGTWAISISGNAATATTASSCTGNAATATTASSCTGNAATATTATYLLTANHPGVAPTYGVNRLEYFNASLSAGAVANANDSPTADWYHHLRMNHANAGGYYVDIAACFHSDNIYWKRVSNGGVANDKWMHIWVEGNAVTSAVWNDYAEYRETDTQEFGRCVIENGDDTMSLSNKRLQKGCSITSDTWGFAQGQTEKAKTPIAVSGRVLAYPFEDKEEFKKHIGDAVCSGPEGTVSIMTDEEVQRYPLSIIGTISAVPDYEEWGGGSDRNPVKVNGRVWIRIK